MKNYILLLLLLISCNYLKNEIPFTRQNVYIEIDQTDEKFNSDTVYDKIYSLIESRIEEKPLNDTLPFSLSMNATFKDVINKIDEYKLSYRTTQNLLNSTKQISINTILSEYSKESVLTFNNDSLKLINQYIYVNGETILPDYGILKNIANSSLTFESKLNSIKSLKFIWDKEKYYSISGMVDEIIGDKVNDKIEHYLEAFKQKYLDPNYIIQNKFKNHKSSLNSNEWEVNYYVNRYFWMKNGVLIDFKKNYDVLEISNSLLSGEYFGIITSAPNIDFKDRKFLIADIKYSSTKGFIEFIKQDKLNYLQKRKKEIEERKNELQKAEPFDRNSWNKKNGL